MTDDQGNLLVLCNAPDVATAEMIAGKLVGAGCAACVNILGECRSIYAWEGKIEDDREIPMLIKTTADSFEQVRKLVVELHPYDVPEVIAVPITRGHDPYLEFIRQACA